jgi:predicted Na+-dependent transporter
VNDEQILVTALSLVSTLAAGLAVDSDIRGIPRDALRMVGLVVASGVALPALAWALDRWLVLGAAGVGLAVASAAQGGSTGPLLAVVARGDATTAARWFIVATLLGTLSAIAVIVALDAFDPRLVGRAALLVTAASLSPLALGLALRRWRPRLARVLAPATARLGVGLLVTTVILLCVRHGHEADATDLGVAMLLVVTSLAPAALVKVRARRIAVAQVCAVHNLALALLVLAALEAPPRAALAVLAYGLVMYIVATVLAIAARVSAPRPAVGP